MVQPTLTISNFTHKLKLVCTVGDNPFALIVQQYTCIILLPGVTRCPVCIQHIPLVSPGPLIILQPTYNNTWLRHSNLTIVLLSCFNFLSQWFLNLQPNQAWAAEMAAQTWLGWRFKNHWLSTIGLLVLILIRDASFWQLWQCLTNWMLLILSDIWHGYKIRINLTIVLSSSNNLNSSPFWSNRVLITLVGSPWFLNLQCNQALTPTPRLC